jgi:predicted amidophosphoribosyltransferase
MRLVAAFEHSGPARKLIHRLKYQGVGGYEHLVAGKVAPRLPRLPLVPVPRVLSRRLAYGVDATSAIARSLASALGVPVATVLRAPIYAARRAGGDHRRPATRFEVEGQLPARLILVDDVVTTGATLVSAAEAVGPHRVALAVAANLAPTVSSLRNPRRTFVWPQF